MAPRTLPIACLVVSRDVIGLDDPVSDNISANVIGLLLGLSARFYLFRTFVFRRPIHLAEIYSFDGSEEAVDKFPDHVAIQDDRLTVSIGGAVFDRRLPLGELLRVADQQLYVAKQNGRNRVAVSPIVNYDSVPAAA